MCNFAQTDGVNDGRRSCFSEHSLLRINERMSMDDVAVKMCLERNLYVDVADVQNVALYKYLVMWDLLAKKPFLLILKKVQDTWFVLTVYETFSGHARRDWVRIRPEHVKEAKRLQKSDMEAQIKAARQILDSFIHLDIVVRYTGVGGSRHVRRHTIDKMYRKEYAERLQSNSRKLLQELLGKMEKLELEIPIDSVIYFEIYKRVSKNKKEILEMGEV